MALALTQVYLEPFQKTALATRAKAVGRKPSEAIREAVDAYIAGVSMDELRMLDEATKRAEKDLKEMTKILDAGQKRAKSFFAEIEKIKAASA